ncbi:MAG: hypothetical protein JKY19_12255 [Alcanivoracaceae bacterium]|nr:hypothetical protein [Alcanivoracaceae bacterium]
MKKLYKWLFILFCFIAAIASYLAGSVRGFGIFIVLGVLFEMGFWIGILKIKTTRSNDTKEAEEEA